MRSLAFLLFSFLLHAEPGELPDQEQAYPELERFIRVLETVRSTHPDAEQLSYERLINYALDGMISSLDPFSSFYHPETAAHLSPDLGNTGDTPFSPPGLGFAMSQTADGLFISSVQKNSPASEASLQVGDQLLKKNEHSLENAELPSAIETLSGPPGEKIALTIYRKSTHKELTANLLRRVVKTSTIADAKLLHDFAKPTLGLVRLTSFTLESPRELENALDQLEDQGMNSLILDLRGNPGGLLDAAVQILGLFLPPETEVVSTQGRAKEAITPPLKTPARQRVKRDYPLMVLIDRNSASASELVAGALQDLKRATIFGEQSFGKGSVQNIQPGPGETALRLTFATYHTPSGKTPHQVGITPDVLINPDDTEFGEEFLQAITKALKE